MYQKKFYDTLKISSRLLYCICSSNCTNGKLIFPKCLWKDFPLSNWTAIIISSMVFKKRDETWKKN
ncbi:hypothetical protein EWI11_01735 [Enterococcus faecium]|uniref:Uncharacterized protein n=2 Tax=Enterococcus TaxID=1350 RepID=A0A133CLY2_ENTFC|nr:hypothetical protein AL026_04940 [Enterococcus faecium]EJX87123.1 hypothetical protein HMPREF1367_02616 [Enterococcus faecium ERV38]KFO17547.1 hypothetical protein L232_0102740 [Enterococcus faecium UC7267]KKJ63116.1 hypothetical protein T640_14620 [Enterococcus faecium MRSN 3418]KKJ71755.1 hypothetical protein T641_12165 [Enterococcus faecium MRSN 4777]MSS53876.1 hypothetical protein [Enterococcus sp. WCA-130-P53-23F]MSS66104.1 hypothetical protein [Enterococcus sp. BSM-130-P53-22D]OFN71